MRVLHLLASRGAGGAEILVRDLSVELRRAGVEVGIAFISRVADLGGAPEFEARYQEILESSSIETFDLGHECRRNPIAGARRLLAVVEQFRPDILHVHLQYGLLFRLLLWPRRIVTVYTHHIDRFRKGRALFRLLALPVDYFVAISRQTERLLRPVVGNCVTLIINAVRFSGARPAHGEEQPKDSLQILSAGGLYPQKDYPTLVQTAACLLSARPDLSGKIRFLIAGGGPEQEQLEEQINRAGLQSTILLLGVRTDVHELMAKSDLLLMTSAYEGLPITLIEALHAGLPIVATDVGGCSEVVEHGVNGFLARPGNQAELARYLQMLVEDPGQRLAFGRKSLEKSAQFSIAANAEQHRALYQRLAKEAGC